MIFFSTLKKGLFLTLFCAVLQVFTQNAEARYRSVPTSQQQIQLSFAPVVKQVTPAVVNIYASKRVRVRTDPFGMNPMFEEFFGRNPFFNNQRKMFGGRTKDKVVNSLGSGVIIDPAGLIITNHHVIAQGDDIKVVLNNKREYQADVVVRDEKTDLALLKIRELDQKLPYLNIQKQSTLEVGDIVIAVGNPYGVGQTVTSGIVSALARTAVGVTDFDFFIQTDAAINPGNSGGALVDLHGELVGINTAIYSKNGGSAGIGFATPAVMVDLILNSYKRGNTSVSRAWIGATTQTLTRDLAESLGLGYSNINGVLVSNVYENGPAALAGLQKLDIITHVDDQPVRDEQGLKFHIATKPLDSKALLTVIRNGSPRYINMRMQLPKSRSNKSRRLRQNHPLKGASVANIDPYTADKLGLKSVNGVVITEISKRDSITNFFKKGDIIRGVNGIQTNSVDELIQLLSEPKRSWKITIERGGQILNLSMNY